MARPKKRKAAGLSTRATRGVLALVVLIAVAFAAWQYRRDLRVYFEPTEHSAPPGPMQLPEARLNPANTPEGATVHLVGKLHIVRPARDAQIGVSAPDAVVLLRKVEMFQWQETCDGGICRYMLDWSNQRFDSRKFRHPTGHNTAAAPFLDATFNAEELRLGDFKIAPELLLGTLTAVDFPVTTTELPPNLAASFSAEDGVLYAGGDAKHPRNGALRISYRIVRPVGEVSVLGVRHGATIETK